MTPFLRSIIDLNLTPIDVSLSGAGELRPPIDVAFSSAKNAANSMGVKTKNSDGLRIRNVNKDISIKMTCYNLGLDGVYASK